MVLPVFAAWSPERFAIGDREVSVRLIPISRVDDAFVDDWLDLERRAIEGNMFLSPLFVRPAVHYLSRTRLLLLAIVRHDGPHRQLIGLGAFVARPPKAGFPLPHLEAYRSPHTFLSGMLLDRDHHWLAIESLATYLSSARTQWCGIEFADRHADGVLSRIYRDPTVTAALCWSEYGGQHRAILRREAAAERLATLLAEGSFSRDLRRKQVRLAKLGDAAGRILVSAAVTADVIETFLRLEDMGWKASEGSSLLSQPPHAAFFRKMAGDFAADGRAFFCELALNGRVIASSSNFVSGRTGFAFKIGWDPEFSAVGPGILNELELMRWIGAGELDIDYVDSGSMEGSYVQRLWNTTTDLTSGMLVGGNVGTAILPALTMARDLKRAVLGRADGG